jgi:hypothetical protein
MNNKSNSLLPSEIIQSKIYVIRGYKVLLNGHLAELYGVTTKRMNEQIKRNIKRFPKDFMFQLTQAEFANLRSQFATSSWGGARYLPYVFTEHGVVMLATILNSDTAIRASLQIVRTFNRIREMIFNHEELRRKIEDLEKKYDARLDKVDNRMQSVFEAFEEIKSLLEPPPDTLKNKVGFV